MVIYLQIDSINVFLLENTEISNFFKPKLSIDMSILLIIMLQRRQLEIPGTQIHQSFQINFTIFFISINDWNTQNWKLISLIVISFYHLSTLFLYSQAYMPTMKIEILEHLHKLHFHNVHFPKDHPCKLLNNTFWLKKKKKKKKKNLFNI